MEREPHNKDPGDRTSFAEQAVDLRTNQRSAAHTYPQVNCPMPLRWVSSVARQSRMRGRVFLWKPDEIAKHRRGVIAGGIVRVDIVTQRLSGIDRSPGFWHVGHHEQFLQSSSNLIRIFNTGRLIAEWNQERRIRMCSKFVNLVVDGWDATRSEERR